MIHIARARGRMSELGKHPRGGKRLSVRKDSHVTCLTGVRILEAECVNHVTAATALVRFADERSTLAYLQ
jgi:hypothetical protein